MTDAEILELESLLKEKEVDISRKKLQTIGIDTNPNYKFLFNAIQEQLYNDRDELIGGFRGCALEGSSRSGKTWSGVDIIIWLCLFVEESCTINIYRETYNEFKTTLYEDFKRRLDDYGLYNPFHKAKEVKSFKIGKSTIYFLGDGKHGGGCDYAFFNEMMFISKSVFDQTEMRCRKFWWSDYNPSVTEHWFFDNVLSRPDVGFLRTTFLNNLKYISAQEKNKILSYEPWKPGTYIVEDNLILHFNTQSQKYEPVSNTNCPPPHPTNIENGTADEFMWKVYGLGLRGAMKGVILPNVTFIDEFPPDIAFTYANDFGFTADPNAFVKYAEDEHNIWTELLLYEPIETPGTLASYLDEIGIDKTIPITCDSSDKYTGENKGTVEMVSGLVKLGYNAHKVNKNKSIMYWLLSMKQKKIHIIKNRLIKHAKKEVENYRFKEINGMSINQPIDGWDHFISATRYAHMSHNKQSLVLETTAETIKKINY